MAKSSPEKLAQALRANLKRRKQAKAGERPEPTPDKSAEPAPKPSKSSLKTGA